MKNRFLFSLVTLAGLCSGAAEFNFNFEQDTPGKPPKGFTFELTGQGAPGSWVVMTGPGAANAPTFVTQTNTDPVSYRFPLCITDTAPVLNPDLRVRFRAISGKKDQAAGLIWRYQNTNNYYVVRANALENNVVLYKVQDGKRVDLKPKGATRKAYGRNVPVASGKWQVLWVKVKGAVFTVGLNEETLFTVEDSSLPDPGRVGLWTKADSLIEFDDLVVKSLD